MEQIVMICCVDWDNKQEIVSCEDKIDDNLLFLIT